MIGCTSALVSLRAERGRCKAAVRGALEKGLIVTQFPQDYNGCGILSICPCCRKAQMPRQKCPIFIFKMQGPNKVEIIGVVAGEYDYEETFPFGERR